MKLSSYARHLGLGYRSVWQMFVAGQIPGAYQLPTGTIIVPDHLTTSDRPAIAAEGGIAVYARVSSSENRPNLVTQSRRLQDFCAARGWVVSQVVEECGSGLNDSRPKLLKLLTDPKISKIVVENRDRLTRFGFNYISTLWHGELVVINENDNDEKDLMTDFVSLVTSFTARLYGRRRSQRKTEKLIQALQDG